MGALFSKDTKKPVEKRLDSNGLVSKESRCRTSSYSTHLETAETDAGAAPLADPQPSLPNSVPLSPPTSLPSSPYATPTSEVRRHGDGESADSLATAPPVCPPRCFIVDEDGPTKIEPLPPLPAPIPAASQSNERRLRRQERSQSLRLDAWLRTEEDKQAGELRLLLLGTGESGKSTLIKQLNQIYGKVYDDPRTRAPYRQMVYRHTLQSIKQLVAQTRRLELDGKIEQQLSAANQGAAELIMASPDDGVMTLERARAVALLWRDPAVREAYQHRNLFQLADECKWFFERIEVLAAADFVPSYQDIIRCRAPTTGLVEAILEVDKRRIRVLDVGGQRSQRRNWNKWLHCFEHATAVVFECAINEFDQVLSEDASANRLQESLELFTELCHTKFFQHTPFIVLLNKSDLFAEKITRVDMKCCFDDYEGGCDYQSAIDYLEDEFRARHARHRPRRDAPFYVHVTCITSTDNVAYTFSAVKDVVTKSYLRESALAI
eukprot:g11857.t1